MFRTEGYVQGSTSVAVNKISYGVPSTTKFMLSNFVVEHAIVIFEHAIMIFKHAIVQIEHAIMIFKHAIVQMKYEIRNGMLILLF